MERASNMTKIEELREAARLEQIASRQKIEPNPWAGATSKLAAAEKAAKSRNDPEGAELKRDMEIYARAVRHRDELQTKLNDARAELNAVLSQDRQVAYLFEECCKAYNWQAAYYNGVRQYSGKSQEPGLKDERGFPLSTVGVKADGTPASPPHLSRITPEQWATIKQLRGLREECARLESLVRQACQPVGMILQRYPSLSHP